MNNTKLFHQQNRNAESKIHTRSKTGSSDGRVNLWRENTGAPNDVTANHKAGTGRPLLSNVLIGCVCLCDPAVQFVYTLFFNSD